MNEDIKKIAKKHIKVASRYLELTSDLMDTGALVSAEQALNDAAKEVSSIRGMLLDSASQQDLPLSVRDGGEE